MATLPYNYANLKASINARLHNKLGLVATPRTIINDVVNEVSDLFLRSSKRKAILAPNLFNDIYQYAAPSDINGNKLVGIQPQTMERQRNDIWELVTEEEFDLRKQTETNLVAFADHTFVRTLLLSARVENLRQLQIASLQNLTSDSSTGAAWQIVGDATNLQTDTYNFIKGSGSVQFDLNTGGTTAGISLTTVNVFDLTSFKSAGSVFTWAYITSTTGVTNFKLRVGNSASNYYEMTATTPNDGTSFVNGWNLIRFDFNAKTTTGSVIDTTCNYVSLFMTKTAGKAADTGYRFNWLEAKQGGIFNLIYYSSNPWQTLGGTLIANSTEDTDYIVCDQDEYNLFVEKGVEVLGMAARAYDDVPLAMARYKDMAKEYKKNYPTEAFLLTSTYRYISSQLN